MRITGHSLEELDALRSEFDTLVEAALVKTCMAAANVLTASALDAQATVGSEWSTLVDQDLVPHIASTYDGASLSVLHQIVDAAPLPPDEGLPAIPNHSAETYLASARNRLQGIGNDVWESVRDQLGQGLSLGESSEQLALRVQAAAEVTLPRARAIARTEINAASNAGAHGQMLFLEMTGVKEWLATDDGRCRETHRLADGQKVEINDTFTVGGWSLKYPGDPNAPAGEIVNCRCTQAYDIDAEAPPKVTCSGLVAASVAAEYCVLSQKPQPIEANADSIAKLSSGEKQTLFELFMSPKAISPAYGGAKIHKQLDAVMVEIKDANDAKIAGLSRHDILSVIDSQYKGGKFTFTEKYNEWLASSAGKKAAPSLAIKEHTAKPQHDPVPQVTATHVAEVKNTATKVESVTSPNVKPKTVPPAVKVHDVSGEPTPVMTNKGHVPIASQAANIDEISNDVQEAFYQAFKQTKVTAVWSGNKIAEAMKTAQEKVFLNDHEALLVLDKKFGEHGGSTGYLDKMVKWESSPQGKKVWGDIPPNVPKVVEKPKVTPPPPKVEVKPESTPQVKPVETVVTKPAIEVSSQVKSEVRKEYKPLDHVAARGEDVSETVPAHVKGTIDTMWTSRHVLSSDDPAIVYWHINDIKMKVNALYGIELSDIEVMQTIDLMRAVTVGLTKSSLIEEKVVLWLKSSPNAMVTAEKIRAGKLKLKKQPRDITPNVAPPSMPEEFSLSEMRKGISTEPVYVFPELPAQAAELMQKKMNAEFGKWTPAERSGLRFYTGQDYQAMNGYLRGEGIYQDPSEKVMAAIVNAQSAMRPSTRPITVFRGCGAAQFNGGTVPDESIIGKKFIDHGFMSTSISSRTSFGGTVNLEIECPVGTPMAYASVVSKWAEEEQEILLAAGTKYEVTAVEPVTRGVTKVRVRVIP